jgi:uncharacterized repeat protein (TIGR04076 family)
LKVIRSLWGLIGVAKVKIVVLKRVEPKAVFGDEVPKDAMTGKEFEKCSRFVEGQEFVVENCGEMPAGFCSWAWRDICKDLTVLQYGGDFPWTKKGEAITCCTDGIRPVSFKLVRI